MKKLLLATTLTLLSSISLAATFSANVEYVVDGDTVYVIANNTKEKIRLAGIDAPESKQEFGQQSKDMLNQLVGGKNVTLDCQTNRDRYQRLICTIYLNNTNINLTMVHHGYAWVYTQYNNDENFYEAEKLAKTERAGLWAFPNPVALWSYRRGKR